MKAARRAIAFFIAFVVLLSSWGNVQAQNTGMRYFPETGHNVRGAFLQYYNAAENPLLVYGYPITEQITGRDGKTVQYFQRARFESTPSNTVQLTPLGRLLYTPTRPLEINTNGCELYPTGHHVCFTFLDFYKTNGGPSQFGYPISPFESSEGLIVQYFEGARFEWRANRGMENWVVVSDLGRIYFEQQGEDPAYLKPVLPLDATIKPIIALKVNAFVAKAVTLKSGDQTVYVIVQDQTTQAVSGVSGKALVRFPDGSRSEFSFTTNERGVGQITFNFNEQAPGELIPIEITVNYQGLTGRTTTSIRIWF
ncbi:MAG: hypothetical protein FIB03_15295 [Anaerolineae bacterium]|nr:hypothetical protein [Anaerolineae bacterium]